MQKCQTPEISKPMTDNDSIERLRYIQAVLTQLRETCLFNSMVDKAIEDTDFLLAWLLEP